jgi:hypothetical protein
MDPRERNQPLSSLFALPWRLAAGAPGWLTWALATVAIAATGLVAVHRHATAGPAPELVADSRAGIASATGSAQTTVATARPSPSVSRSQSRVERILPRSAPLKRKPPQPKVPLAPANAVQTAASAVASSTNVPGQCLAWSREQADIPSKYPDATSAWEHATGRRPGDTDPPRGAAVYWTGGSAGHGHIAISLGHGRVRSSDADGSGDVGTVPLRFFDREWNLHYVGWANSINGYQIPGVAPA